MSVPQEPRSDVLLRAHSPRPRKGFGDVRIGFGILAANRKQLEMQQGYEHSFGTGDASGRMLGWCSDLGQMTAC